MRRTGQMWAAAHGVGDAERGGQRECKGQNAYLHEQTETEYMCPFPPNSELDNKDIQCVVDPARRKRKVLPIVHEAHEQIAVVKR